jgi:hypothetical protein
VHKYHPGSGGFVNRLWLYASGLSCSKLHFDFLGKPIPDSQFPNSIDPQDFFPRFAVAGGKRAEVVKTVLPLFAGIVTLTAALVMARHPHMGVFSSIFHTLSKYHLKSVSNKFTEETSSRGAGLYRFSFLASCKMQFNHII